MIKKNFDKILLLKNSDSIYIQIIIYQHEIAYLIEKMNEEEKSAENQVIKFIKSQRLKPDEKILVFSQYIKMIERLQETLDCVIYHANEMTKIAQLKT